MSLDRGPWIMTYTGIHFYFLDPYPDEICIEDIAHALSMQCRFGGHSRNFYSVAEHSYYVSMFSPWGYKKAGLLHDASEAYLVDIPRPIKHSVNMSGYRAIEDKLQKTIDHKFSVDSKTVKQWDREVFSHEVLALMKHPEQYANVPELKISPIHISGWLPNYAEEMFLERYKELCQNQ